MGGLDEKEVNIGRLLRMTIMCKTPIDNAILNCVEKIYQLSTSSDALLDVEEFDVLMEKEIPSPMELRKAFDVAQMYADNIFVSLAPLAVR